jgi:hypothetical protein
LPTLDLSPSRLTIGTRDTTIVDRRITGVIGFLCAVEHSGIDSLGVEAADSLTPCPEGNLEEDSIVDCWAGNFVDLRSVNL